ncbi:tyrosine-type recombinase/integrase [Terripilifer ovatus]|uniref:tyrosine-type recombinase/integrase n=1 Tax=Terripilifer ovatus TaxID=3032367 RepID=UPI0009E8F424
MWLVTHEAGFTSVLRHTAAMELLHAGVDTPVISLRLGHESTRSMQRYLHAHLALREAVGARGSHGRSVGRPPQGG